MKASVWDAIVDSGPRWLNGALCVAFVVFLLLPFAVALPISFSRLAVFPPADFTTEWYVKFFASDQFNDAWRVSLLLALIAASLATFIGAALALAVTRFSFPGKDVLANLTLSPLIVPGVATGVGLVFYFTYVGILNGWLRLVIAHVIITVPYVVRVMMASLHSFDRSLEEAAMNLGATEHYAFWSVTLPVVRTGLAAGFLFAFMASFENLPATVFVVQPGTRTMPVVLFDYVRDDFNPIVAVVTVVMVGVAATAMWIDNRMVGLERLMGVRSD
jgi:putative spermidine/putrescine transport system permease protein